MYHLLNSIYVDTCRRIDRSYDTITISKEHGFLMPDELTMETGKQLYFAQSLDTADHAALLAAIAGAVDSEKRTMIYCDSDTYMRLLAMLAKAVLPAISKDDFRYIALCKKAMFGTTISAYGEPRVDVLASLDFSLAKVDEAFDRTEDFQDEFNSLIKANPHAVSLEWRLIKLRLEDTVGKIPKTIKNILRRIALSNAHDALEVWGRHITNEKYWEMAGIDIDTIMSAPSIFEAAMNFPHLASKQLLRPGLYDFRPNDRWLVDMLGEAIRLMEVLEDVSSAERAKLIRGYLSVSVDMADPKVCLARANEIFNGPKRIALASRDTGKYDENLIRFILNMSDEKLLEVSEGADW